MSIVISVSSSSSSHPSSFCLRSFSRIHSQPHENSKLNLNLLLLATQSFPFSSPTINLKRTSFHVSIRRLIRNDVVFYSLCDDDHGEPAPPPPPPPPSHFSAPWKFWIVGMLMYAAVLPFSKNGNKWMPFIVLKQKVDVVMETADDVAEIVEDVAERVEEVAEVVSKHLPVGGRRHETAKIVGNVARKTAIVADLTQDIIDKVQEVEDEVASFVKTQVEKIRTRESQRKQKEEDKSKERENENMKKVTVIIQTNKETILQKSTVEEISNKLKGESNGDTQ